MDHNEVVRDKMTEKYLLNELDPGIRDQFEEHYFDCAECAMDVRSGVQFVAQARIVLSEPEEPAPLRLVPKRPNERRDWLAWLRPAFAVPALALLVVVGYQNLGLRSQLTHPQVLPAVSVNVGTWGAGGPATAVAEGKGLLLFIRIPPDSAYVRYTADIYDPAGKAQGSFTMTPTRGQDQWPVAIPALQRQAGTYTMAIHGITAGGESKNLGSASFELQLEK